MFNSASVRYSYTVIFKSLKTKGGSPAWARTTIRLGIVESVTSRVFNGLKCQIGPEKPALVHNSYTDARPAAWSCCGCGSHNYTYSMSVGGGEKRRHFRGVWRRHWRRVGQSIGGDAIGTPQKLKGVTGARADGHGLSAAVKRPAECLYSLQVRVSGISESIDETLLTCSRFWRKDRRYATLSHPLSYRGKVPQPGP